MEKLASRQAISELVDWMAWMEKMTAEDEENLKSAVGSTVIQEYLNKYKVIIIIIRDGTILTRYSVSGQILPSSTRTRYSLTSQILQSEYLVSF